MRPLSLCVPLAPFPICEAPDCLSVSIAAALTVIAALEAILSVTATTNTTLEGDFTFANDPHGVTEAVAWLFTLANLVLTVLFIGHVRRIKGYTRYWCLFNEQGRAFRRASAPTGSGGAPPPLARQDSRQAALDLRRLRLVELFTWLSLIISMFQVVRVRVRVRLSLSSSRWSRWLGLGLGLGSRSHHLNVPGGRRRHRHRVARRVERLPAHRHPGQHSRGGRAP